ncbi:MAG: Fic family protein [Actinomycetota bacterium]
MATGGATGITWRGRAARAWVPNPLTTLDLELSVEVVRRTEQAAAAVRLANAQLPVAWEPLARLLLRAEGVASSDIEGVRAPAGLVALAEAEPDAVGGTAAWIADNLATLRWAIADDVRRPLTLRTLHRWHKQLMRHGTLPGEMVGRFRTAQGWIGGSSPLDAAFVPPPPDLVGDLMDDLVAFANRDDLDPVTQAAVAHAQFETIHPYGDGNGRIGRVLIGWILGRRERVVVPPPVSVLIARDPGGYLSGLHAFREGPLDAWVGWFAGIVLRAANGEAAFVTRIQMLLADWRDRLRDLRSDAAARRVIEVLPELPVLSAALVAGCVGVSERAARGALETLSDRGIIEPIEVVSRRAGRPRRLWIAGALTDAVGSSLP